MEMATILQKYCVIAYLQISKVRALQIQTS